MSLMKNVSEVRIQDDVGLQLCVLYVNVSHVKYVKYMYVLPLYYDEVCENSDGDG